MKRRIGLVLPGGGAKGAFQQGFLEELTKHAELRIEAVSGTSVGALNALSWATDSVDAGGELWRNACFSRVSGRNFPRGLQWLAASVIFLARLLLMLQWVRLRSKALRFGQSIIVFVLFLPGMLWFVQEPMAHLSSVPPAIFYSYAVLMSLGAAWAAPDYHGAAWPGMQAPIQLFVVIYAAALLFGAYDWFGLEGLVGTGATYALLIAVASTSWRNLNPLKAPLARMASNGLRCRVFVTTSKWVHFWRPDRYDRKTAGVYGGGTWDVRASFYEHVPIYHSLNGLPVAAIVDAVLASASLPMGITKAVRINGDSHIDGGWTDNCPMYPLLNMDCLTDVLVVHLATELELQEETPWPASHADNCHLPHICLTSENVRTCWYRFDRLVHLVQYCSSQEFDDQDFGRREEREFRPSRDLRCIPRIHHIFPPQSLGISLADTLNFDPEHIAKLIEWGRAEARKALSALRD